MISTAMILGAGLGTRMRPLTEKVPKPLVLFQKRPLIDYVLDKLERAGITKVVVNVHYLADVLEEHLQKRKYPSITISDERSKLLDTGGGVLKALPLLGDKPFIIHNSDTAWIERGSAWLPDLINAWDSDSMDALLLLARTKESIGYDGNGDFDIDSSRIVRRRGQNSIAPYVFTGVSIAHPRLFNAPPGDAFSLNILWDRAINTRRLKGVCLDGTWMHLGTPEALLEAEKKICT